MFVLRIKNARNLDATTVLALESLHDYLLTTKRFLLISGITDEVRAVLARSGLLAQIGEENISHASGESHGQHQTGSRPSDRPAADEKGRDSHL